MKFRQLRPAKTVEHKILVITQLRVGAKNQSGRQPSQKEHSMHTKTTQKKCYYSHVHTK